MNVDVLIAGGGIAGLLLASELAGNVDVALVERKRAIPDHKYWLTSEATLTSAKELVHCLDGTYESMDFIAYDDSTARISGIFPLWDTKALIKQLRQKALHGGCQIRTDARLYSLNYDHNSLRVRVGREVVSCKLLIDCMGFDSPLLSAKGIADILGFFVLTGATFELTSAIDPIGLHNPILQGTPTFLELFPTADGHAHVVLIQPVRGYRDAHSLGSDLRFLVTESHYSNYLGASDGQRLHGIIPVGRLRKRSLDRILFFGESGQANPATSATGLTRMMHTYKEFAAHVVRCVESDKTKATDIVPPVATMSSFNRRFQEELFRSLLAYNSDRFLALVNEMGWFEDWIVRDLIFAELELDSKIFLRLIRDWLQGRTEILGPIAIKSWLSLGIHGAFKKLTR